MLGKSKVDQPCYSLLPAISVNRLLQLVECLFLVVASCTGRTPKSAPRRCATLRNVGVPAVYTWSQSQYLCSIYGPTYGGSECVPALIRPEESPRDRLRVIRRERLGVAEKSSSEQESTEQADSSPPAGIVTFLTTKMVARVARAFALFVAILPLVILCHSGVDAQTRCRKWLTQPATSSVHFLWPGCTQSKRELLFGMYFSYIKWAESGWKTCRVGQNASYLSLILLVAYISAQVQFALVWQCSNDVLMTFLCLYTMHMTA